MRWTLTAIIVLSLLAPLLVASACGDGICSRDENCSTCSLDCGKCNLVSCSLNNDCYSNICCNGVCSSSCVVYNSTKSTESPYVAAAIAADNYPIILGALVFIVIVEIVIAFIILRREKIG